jgi:hypothetical protein
MSLKSGKEDQCEADIPKDSIVALMSPGRSTCISGISPCFTGALLTPCVGRYALTESGGDYILRHIRDIQTAFNSLSRLKASFIR